MQPHSSSSHSRLSTPRLGPAAHKLQHLVQHKLPLSQDEDRLRELTTLMKACSNEELAALGLQPPPPPALPPCSCIGQMPMAARLQAVQSVLTSLQYNHSSGYNYNVSKQRPLHAILATAAGVLMHPLPIKCIEAVFLGLLLTQGWTQLQRLPLGFKSKASNGQVYRHIVLAVFDASSGMFGALGLSRCSRLMDKQLVHSSLSALVQDYQAAYTHVSHTLLKVRVGLPVEHDPMWRGPVCWRYCTVGLQKRTWMETAVILDQHAATAQRLQEHFRAAVAAATTSESSSRGTGSHSTSGGSPGPHITKPHPISTVRCSTSTLAAERLPRLVISPNKQQAQSSSCSSPATPKSPKVALHLAKPPAALTCGDTGSGKPQQHRSLAAAMIPAAGQCDAGSQGVAGICEHDTSDEEAQADSDSEVNALVAWCVIRQQQHQATGSTGSHVC